MGTHACMHACMCLRGYSRGNGAGPKKKQTGARQDREES